MECLNGGDFKRNKKLQERKKKVEKLKQFKKIVMVEPVYLSEKGRKEISKFCKELVSFDAQPQSENELIERIGDADCILVSPTTIVSKKVIDKCKNMKFINMCCSYYGAKYAKVDTLYAEKKGIAYSYLKDYGDNGVVEYTISSVVDLCHGIHGKKWKKDVNDLTAIKVGILGFGSLGTKIANAFNNFGTKVFYFSKTRKPQFENDMIKYLPLDELLKKSDVISINLNRDVCLIGGDKLQLFGNGKVLINTSIGHCYEKEPLRNWLKNPKNFYVCDACSINDDVDLLEFENVCYLDRSCGVTKQTLERATEQTINNLKNFLKN